MKKYMVLIASSLIAGTICGMEYTPRYEGSPEEWREADDKRLEEAQRMRQRVILQREMAAQTRGLAVGLAVGVAAFRVQQNPNQAASIARSLKKTKEDFEKNVQQFKASYTQEEKKALMRNLEEIKRRRAKLGKEELD